MMTALKVGIVMRIRKQKKSKFITPVMNSINTNNKGVGIYQICQLNLQGAKAVTFELFKKVDSKKIDITCITEPYSSQGKLMGIPFSRTHSDKKILK